MPDGEKKHVATERGTENPKKATVDSTVKFGYLSVEEFALELHVSSKLIREEIKRGNIYAARVGRLLRIPRSELPRRSESDPAKNTV